MMSAIVLVTVQVRVSERPGSSALAQTLGLVSLHHLLAEVHADQIVLIDVVIEHVLSGFAEIDESTPRSPAA